MKREMISNENSLQVQDSSIGGSSDDEDLLGVIRGPSTFANAFLYIGQHFNFSFSLQVNDYFIRDNDHQFSLMLYVVLLVLGLGTISLGSIIFFVGTGEKGFKTQELRLIGPALAGE